MTPEAAANPAPIASPDQRRARRLGLIALCITEIISWGVLYYAFPVALSAITADTGWSASAASAAFSAGLVVSAVVGIGAGRVLDARGPRLVMSAGSVLAVPAVLGVAFAPSLAWFTAAWIVAGVAMAGVFYPPAFAAVTRWYGPDRMKALLALTLVAGLSSTIFAPLTAALLEQLSWRATFTVLAVVLAVTTVPLHALALRVPWPTKSAEKSQPASVHQPAPESAPPAPRPVRAVVASPGFLLLCAAFTVLSLGFYLASLGLIPLLSKRGFSHTLAATTLGLLGAGQLLGRLGYAPLARHASPLGRFLTVVGVAAAGVLALAVAPAAPGVLISAAVLLGAMRGLFTLLQAAVITDRWGTSTYGSLSGIFAAPITTATALAPWAAPALAGVLGGYAALFLLTTGLILVSAVVGVASWKVKIHQ